MINELFKGWAQKILWGVLYTLPLVYVGYLVTDAHQKPVQMVKSQYDALIESSLFYLYHDEPQKSIALLKSAIKMNADDAGVYNSLCVAYNVTKQYQQGINACRRAIELAPDFQLAKNNLQWGMNELAREKSAS